MKIDHIGIAVRSIATAEKLFVDALGGKVRKRETVGPMNLHILKLDLGGVVLELLEPANEKEAVVSKFLASHGEGIHHICYAVPDIRRAQQELQAKGYAPIWPEPRMGSEHRLVTFLHPKQTHSVLIELSESR